jgi:hypothetical protein
MTNEEIRKGNLLARYYMATERALEAAEALAQLLATPVDVDSIDYDLVQRAESFANTLEGMINYIAGEA